LLKIIHHRLRQRHQQSSSHQNNFIEAIRLRRSKINTLLPPSAVVVKINNFVEAIRLRRSKINTSLPQSAVVVKINNFIEAIRLRRSKIKHVCHSKIKHVVSAIRLRRHNKQIRRSHLPLSFYSN
jgi:hypothetical protein